MSTLLVSVAVAILAQPPTAPTTAPAPFATVRLDRPDEQLSRFLSLFKGTGVDGPASALAAWKLADPTRGFSKAAEAGLAVLNSEMVAELRSLDGLRVAVRSRPDGRLGWWAEIPKDDGTFDALATAMTLTGGRRLAAENGKGPVDEIGPAGSPVMSVAGPGLPARLAATSEELTLAQSGRFLGTDRESAPASGLTLILEPDAIAPPSALSLRLAVEALKASGCRRMTASAAIEGDDLLLQMRGRFDAPPPLGSKPIDPAWLAAIPKRDLLGAFAVAVDPSPEFWNAAFAWADRVEKVVPDRAGVAPLRTRLALIARSAGIRPEVDLFPHLVGLSGHVQAAGGKPTSGVVGLHFRSAEAASRFRSQFLEKLARMANLGEPATDKDGRTRWSRAGNASDYEAQLDGASVWVGWGDGAIDESRRCVAEPAAALASGLADKVRGSQRVVFARPSAMVDEVPGSSDVLWTGTLDGSNLKDEIRWTHLADVVRRAVERSRGGPAQ